MEGNEIKYLVFATGRSQYLWYCDWKGLDPEEDAEMHTCATVTYAKILAREGKSVPPDYLVVLPNVSMSKTAREKLIDKKYLKEGQGV